jgi:hypothetical protein
MMPLLYFNNHPQVKNHLLPSLQASQINISTSSASGFFSGLATFLEGLLQGTK